MECQGCSCIGVTDEPEAELQPPPLAYSKIWRAPEYNQRLTPENLFQTDIYSYGLTVWQIMLDGVHPYHFLYWDAEETKAFPSTATPPENVTFLTKEAFHHIKSSGNILVGLALDTMEESHDRDDVVEIMTDMLTVSLQMELSQQCRTVDNLVSMLCGSSPNAASTT
jgi:serine/threonine protein kinase